MRASSILFLFITALLFSCTRSGQPIQTQDAATFVVDPVVGVGEESSSGSTFANVPTSRLVDFTACLKDVAELEPVVGATFQVADGARVIPLKSSATDAKGCLYWSENIPFTATGQETFYAETRTITALSVHQGRVSVKLAVDPWQAGANATRDLRFQSAPAALDTSRAEAQEKADGESALVIESVAADLDIVKSTDAVAEADLQLSFEPKMRRTGIDGAQILESLTSGKFQVRAQLLALSGSVLPLTEVSLFPGGEFQKGLVQLKARIRILRKIPREASLRLSFEADPVDAPAGLAPVKGTVSLGKLTSLTLSKTAPLEREPQLSFLQPLPAPAAGSQGGQFGFELGKVRATDVVVQQLDSTGKPSRLDVEFSACLFDSISQQKLTDKSFTVSFEQEQSTEKTDPESGCRKWRHTYAFDYNAKESLIRENLQVKSADSFYGDQQAERAIDVDLWNYQNPEKMVVDEKYDGKPPESVAEKGPGSELTISSSFYNFMGRTFDVDSHLDLGTTRTYRFEFEPRISRLSRSHGWLPPEGIGNGHWQAKFLLETLDKDHPQVVDAETVPVDAHSGIISPTVSFHVRDIRRVNTRLNLSIQVEPRDPSVNLRTRPYEGTFDMSGFSIRLSEKPGSIDERMQQAEQPGPPEQDGAELFAQAKGHRILSAQRRQELGLTDGLLSKFFAASDPKTLAPLCSLYFDPSGWSWFSSYKSCTKDPGAYLLLVPTEHVRKVYGSKLAGNIQTSTLSMMAGVVYSDYESHDEASSRVSSNNIETQAGLSVPLLNLIGLNIGFGVGTNDSWNTTSTYIKSKTHSSTRSGDQYKQMTVDEADFRIDADVDHCLQIARKEEGSKDPVYMACLSAPERKTVTENYYLIYQNTVGGALVDSGASLADRPFLALVRGQERFQDFVKVMQDPDATLSLSRGLPAPVDLMHAADERYDGFFPGMLTGKFAK